MFIFSRACVCLPPFFLTESIKPLLALHMCLCERLLPASQPSQETCTSEHQSLSSLWFRACRVWVSEQAHACAQQQCLPSSHTEEYASDRRLVVNQGFVVASGEGTSHVLACTCSPITLQIPAQRTNTALMWIQPVPDPITQKACFPK